MWPNWPVVDLNISYILDEWVFLYYSLVECCLTKKERNVFLHSTKCFFCHFYQYCKMSPKTNPQISLFFFLQNLQGFIKIGTIVQELLRPKEIDKLLAKSSSYNLESSLCSVNYIFLVKNIIFLLSVFIPHDFIYFFNIAARRLQVRPQGLGVSLVI